MSIGLRSIALAAAGCGCIGAMVMAAACIVAPPPELPPARAHRPTILHTSVSPPADLPLTVWPSEFSVPVELDDPNQAFYWDVFVDYDGTSPFPITGETQQPVTASPAALDGGVMSVTFSLDPISFGIDETRCHRIEMFVAHGFAIANPRQQAFRTFDYVGGDSVVWFFTPPDGCFGNDAGDAAFVPNDAPSESLPVPPGGDR
jgi:hypothetical protein